MKNQPPPMLDSAKVLKYALVASSVQFTGRLCLYVNGKLLGKVPNLAICQNYKAKDYLLFFCNAKWKVLGVAGYKTIKETKEKAERAYKGITKKWITIARPNVFKDWPGDLGPVCSFCGKTIFEGLQQIYGRDNAFICNECIKRYHDLFEKEQKNSGA